MYTYFINIGKFQKEIIAVAGQPTAADADGDGYAEIYVPSYTLNFLYVFSYTPEE